MSRRALSVQFPVSSGLGHTSASVMGSYAADIAPAENASFRRLIVPRCRSGMSLLSPSPYGSNIKLRHDGQFDRSSVVERPLDPNSPLCPRETRTQSLSVAPEDRRDSSRAAHSTWNLVGACRWGGQWTTGFPQGGKSAHPRLLRGQRSASHAAHRHLLGRSRPTELRVPCQRRVSLQLNEARLSKRYPHRPGPRPRPEHSRSSPPLRTPPQRSRPGYPLIGPRRANAPNLSHRCRRRAKLRCHLADLPVCRRVQRLGV